MAEKLRTPSRLFGTIGSKIIAYGHSFITGGGVTHPDRQYITQLAGLLRGDLVDLGVGGSQAAHDESWPKRTDTEGQGGWAHVLQNELIYRTTQPYMAAMNIPLLHYGHNDVQYHSHDATGAPRTTWKHAMRTIMSRCVSAKVYEETDATVVFGGGTWQPVILDTKRNSGTGYRVIPANNATFTITLPADFDGGPIAVGILVWPGSDGQIAWSGTAAHGSPAATQLAGLAYAAGGTAHRRNSCLGIVVRFTGLTAADATKTIIGTYSGGAGTTASTPAQLGALTVVGTIGTTTYGYKHYYRFANGDTLPSTERTVATGNATLTASNRITIPAGAAWPTGCIAEVIVRTTGGANNGGQGIIQILTAGPASYDDIGRTPAAYTAVTANPMLGGAAFDYWQTEANDPMQRGVLMKLNRPPSGAYLNGAGDADIANYNADLDALIAEFFPGQWVGVDVDAELSASSLYFDGVNPHPNDRGHALVSTIAYSAIQRWALGLPDLDIAATSRVSKTITSRRLANARLFAVGGMSNDIIGQGDRPMSGTIVAASLPFAGPGTADYTLDATARLINLQTLVQAINADIGDDIEVELSAMLANTAIAVTLDVAFCSAAGAVIRYFSAADKSPTVMGSLGNPAWYANGATAILTPVTGKQYATVQASDLITLNSVPGQVMVALIGLTASSTRVMYGAGGSGSPGHSFSVKNVGRRNVGFNSS